MPGKEKSAHMDDLSLVDMDSYEIWEDISLHPHVYLFRLKDIPSYRFFAPGTSTGLSSDGRFWRHRTASV
jgi:hypothetical protein